MKRSRYGKKAPRIRILKPIANQRAKRRRSNAGEGRGQELLPAREIKLCNQNLREKDETIGKQIGNAGGCKMHAVLIDCSEPHL